MVDGLNHIISQVAWYMDLTDVILEDNWEDSAAFSKLQRSLEKQVVETYEALL